MNNKKKVINLVTILLVFGFAMLFNATNTKAVTKYTIKYYTNGGTGNTITDTKKSGGSYTFRKNTTYTRKGYTLSKWNTEKNGSGTSYACGKKITVKKSYKVYAIWSANSYTVTFNSQGGNSIASKKVTYAGTYGALATPQKQGYTFDGWYTAATGGTKISSTTKVTILKDQVLYAHWVAKKFTVTFDSQGGTGVAGKTVTYAGTYGTLTVPQKKGYTFIGWYTAITGGKQILASDKVTVVSNHTLFAHWTENTYKLVFVSNYPDEVGKKEDMCIFRRNLKYSVAYHFDDIIIFDAQGYHVESWNTREDGSGRSFGLSFSAQGLGGEKDSGEYVRLYAQWKKNHYTIKYEANGGDGEVPKNMEVEYMDLIQLSTSQLNRKGYEFKCWSTSAEGKEEDLIYDNAMYLEWNMASKADRNNIIHLYAIWEPVKIQLGFNANEKEESSLDINTTLVVPYGSVINNLPVPIYKKYVFLYWVTEDGKKVSNGDINNFLEDTVLTAVVEKKKIQITVNSNNGTSAIQRTVNIASKFGSLNLTVPKKSGYIFKGWYYKKNNVETQVNSNTSFDVNTIIYAVWEKVKKPSKASKLNAKIKKGKLRVAFKNVKADGYTIVFKYNKKTYKKDYFASQWKLSKGKRYKDFEKIPGKNIKFKKVKKCTIKIIPYNIDSTNNQIMGDKKSITFNNKSK